MFKVVSTELVKIGQQVHDRFSDFIVAICDMEAGDKVIAKAFFIDLSLTDEVMIGELDSDVISNHAIK